MSEEDAGVANAVFSCLSAVQWKRVHMLVREAQAKLRKAGAEKPHIAVAFIFTKLEQWEDAGLVESQEVEDEWNMTREFRLTQKGGARLNAPRSGTPQSNTGGMVPQGA